MAGLSLAVGNALAQAPPDTTIQIPDDTVSIIQHPFADEPYAVGALLDSIALAQSYYLDPTEPLADVPGGFSLSLGNLGWPHQWTYLGMPPSAIELTIDGITLRDPVTNRSMFDVVPIDMVVRQRQSLMAHGGPVQVQSRIRPLAALRPYTELKYETGAAGLQSISALHVQQRSWQIFGAPTITQFVARFGFHEWAGKYPNSSSDLAQAFGRVGFTSRRWRIRFTDSYTLRDRGAHSGVRVKSGQGFDSVYDQFDATVGDPSATQRLRRNQFDISVEHTWESDVKPLAVWSSYTTSSYRYSNESEAETSSSEFSIKVEQESPEFVSGHEFTGRFSFEMTDISSVGLLNGGGGSTKSRMTMSADDQFAVGQVLARAILGVHAIDQWVFPSAGFNLRRSFGGFSAAAEGSIHGRAPSPLEKAGGLGVSITDQSLEHTTTQSVQVSIDAPGPVFRLGFTGFVSRLIDPVEIVRSGSNAYVVQQSSGSVAWRGITGTLGWRSTSSRGLYALITPTVQSVKVSVSDEVTDGLASSLPAFFASARFGYRNQFFLGDLDANFYVVAHYWSAFRSRVYNPVHALLVLPAAGSTAYGGSGTLDIRLEAGIREATIFLSVDNVLSGLAYPGVLVVPVYPIPAQAFRFGVLWPIDG
ncbi:putative porin [Bacteroidota bacterium]